MNLLHPKKIKEIISKDKLSKNPFERLIITCEEKSSKK